MNAQELILKTNREIKNLNQRLLRIVPTESIHTNLIPNKPYDLEIIEGASLLCKLDAKGMLSPAKFKVQFRGAANSAKNDLVVYISQQYQEPDEKRCEQVVKYVKIKI